MSFKNLFALLESGLLKIPSLRDEKNFFAFELIVK